MKKRGDWLKARREELKQKNKTRYSIRAVAERLGLSYSGLYHLESTDAMPTLDLALKLANELDRSLEWVLTGINTDSAKRIPIIGTTETGPALEWFENGCSDSMLGEYVDVSVPNRNLYGLKVLSDGLAKYNVGEVLIADPNMEPVTGEDVLVVLDDDGGFAIKILASQRDGKVFLDSPDNRSQRMICDRDKIVLIHPVILVAKSAAVKSF